MVYPALSQNQLSRFSYHWFWGLGVDKSGVRTLYDEAVSLRSNIEERDKIIGRVVLYNELPWVLLAICWAANINNYRINCYKLYSYISLVIYEDEVVKLSAADRLMVEKVAGLLVMITTTALGLYLLNYFSLHGVGSAFERQSDWFMQRLQPYLPLDMKRYENTQKEDIEANFESSSSSSMQLTVKTYGAVNKSRAGAMPQVVEDYNLLVTTEIYDSLQLLGFSLNIGQQFTFRELKKAYKKSMLLTHPDKTGRDSMPEFLAVTSAYDQILEKITLGQDKQCMTSDFAAYLSKFNELVKKERAFWKGELNFWKQELVTWREINNRLERLGEGIYLFGESIRETREQISQLSQDMDETKAILDEEDAIAGLPPVTEEEIQAVLDDPEYFNKKYAAMAENSRENPTFVVPVSIFTRIETDSNDSTTPVIIANNSQIQ
ncbi:MAG: J domain-containing protein [Legionellaceae bacterium]|nr:J domain-containing protein [Legionellaceae bacterium]